MEMPVFVKIDRYHEALQTLETNRKNLAQAKQLLARLNDVRVKQDTEIQQLDHELSVIESKFNELQKLFNREA